MLLTLGKEEPGSENTPPHPTALRNLRVSRFKPTIKEIFLTDLSTRDATTQEEFERNFYSRLRLPNDVYKTTHTRRFDDLNLLVNDLLPRGRRLEILDVGISSGISTAEWLDALRTSGIDARVTGGDLDINVYFLSVGGWLDVLIDRTGYVLQLDLGGRSITNHARFPFARRALLAPLVFCMNAAFKIFWLLNPELRRHIAADGGERAFALSVRCRPQTLLSPRLRPDEDLLLIEDDIVAGDELLADHFDAIRAANVLNFYLDPQMLVSMLDTLRRRLRVGGLLILCRTNNQGRNLGTIFRINEGREFEVAGRIGAGSEIEAFVLSGGDPATLQRPTTRS